METRFKSSNIVSWSAVLSGFLVSLLGYMLLSSLGAGVLGITVSQGSGVRIFAGLWMAASAIIALFSGCYFATRLFGITHRQLGASLAVVISAAFFYVLLTVASSTFSSFTDVTARFSHPNAISDANAQAKTIGATGWLLFFTLALGIAASVLGAIEGVMRNIKYPFDNTVSLKNQSEKIGRINEKRAAL
jgi:hypothetical protein